MVCEELEQLMEQDNNQRLYAYLEEKLPQFFEEPDLLKLYQVLQKVDTSSAKNEIPRLTIVWVAFLCGDNSRVYGALDAMKDKKLEDVYERSSYYALCAITGFHKDTKQRIEDAQNAVCVLPANDTSFYMANAKLTLAQILAGGEKYRLSVQYFYESYQIFQQLHSIFPAVTALVNHYLKRYTLGEVKEIINDCSNHLVMGQSCITKEHNSYDILHLPLGICFLESNQVGLAMEHFLKVQKCIDEMNYLHMHGMVEYYLYFCYLRKKDTQLLEAYMNQMEAAFGQQNYPFMKILLAMFHIRSEHNAENIKASDAEYLEYCYGKINESGIMIVTETLFYLQLAGKSNRITISDISKKLEHYRYAGNLPQVISCLIILSELLYMKEESLNAASCMKEAVTLAKENELYLAFYLNVKNSMPLIQKLDKQLYQSLCEFHKKTNDGTSLENILTKKENEILLLVEEGKSNDEIAKQLFLSVGTVKWHLNHIYSKLGVENRVSAINKAKEFKKT